TRPISVEWKQRAVVDGKTNRVDVLGDLTATTSDDTGATHGVTAQRLTMTLADTPAEARKEDAEQADAGKDDAGKDDAGKEDSDGPSFLAGKEATDLRFEEKVEVRSVRTANDQAQQRLHLFAAAKQYAVKTQLVTVPVAGRLLYEAPPPPAGGQGGGAQDAPCQDAARPQVSGATAIGWEKSLTYDPAKGLIDIHGSVQVVHEPNKDAAAPKNADSAPMRLWADHVQAELKQEDKPADNPANPAGGRAPELRRVTATGNVRVNSQQ